MPLTVFEPAISAREQQQTLALERLAIDDCLFLNMNYLLLFLVKEIYVSSEVVTEILNSSSF
jgi:hypothetical protein